MRYCHTRDTPLSHAISCSHGAMEKTRDVTQIECRYATRPAYLQAGPTASACGMPSRCSEAIDGDERAWTPSCQETPQDKKTGAQDDSRTLHLPDREGQKSFGAPGRREGAQASYCQLAGGEHLHYL